MSQHIPQALLQKFVDGDLEEPVAIAVAQHVDGCSRCSSEAASSDPLSQAFASTTDPIPPAGLAVRIKEASADTVVEERQPTRAPINLRLFFAAAAVLLVVFLSPFGVLDETSTAVHTAANRSEESIGRGGSIGLAIGFLLGITIAAVVYRKRKAD